jgi:hypothetical protein
MSSKAKIVAKDAEIRRLGMKKATKKNEKPKIVAGGVEFRQSFLKYYV